MTREELKNFVSVYNKSVRTEIKGKDKEGKDVEEQTSWPFFDREVIEKLLAQTDPKAGGIKIYLGQYDKNNLDLVPKDRIDREDYIGRVSLALSAANREEDGIFDIFDTNLHSDGGTGSIENGAAICPPYCRPPINIWSMQTYIYLILLFLGILLSVPLFFIDGFEFKKLYRLLFSVIVIVTILETLGTYLANSGRQNVIYYNVVFVYLETLLLLYFFLPGLPKSKS